MTEPLDPRAQVLDEAPARVRAWHVLWLLPGDADYRSIAFTTWDGALGMAGWLTRERQLADLVHVTRRPFRGEAWG